MKSLPSKLDRFAETLAEMDAEKKTLAEIRDWLKNEGVTAGINTISRFLEHLRQLRLEQSLFEQIASGARMNKELDQAYKDNPPPDVERLITVTKTLIASLQVKGVADPKLLSLANSMQQTVLMHLHGLTKARLEEKKLDIAERKTRLQEKKAEAYDRAQAAISEAKKSKGGITKETLNRIESELRLL